MRKSFCALVLLTLAASASAEQPARAQASIANSTTEQVRNGLVAWCITNQMDVAESEANRVACTKPVGGGRGFMIQALSGDGATPLVRLEVAFAQAGSDVIATGRQQLETQRADGTVHREDFQQREVIAGTQGILDEVAATLAAKPATASPEPAAAQTDRTSVGT